MTEIIIFLYLIITTPIFIILVYCIQKWVYMCCKELRKLNKSLEKLQEN